MKDNFFAKNQIMERIIHVLSCRYYNYMGENSWNRDIERLFGQITAWSCADPTSLTFGKADIDLHLEAYCMELKLKDILKQLMFFKIVTLSEYRNYLRLYRGWDK